YAAVFARDILDNDGTWTDGANSVSVAASHEVVELLADPVCNHYVDGLDGYMYALEVADPTEGDSYTIGDVAVSNFVYPEYWNPWAKHENTKFDHLDLITRPFEVRENGYAVRYRGEKEDTIWGPAYPKWRIKMKTTKPHRRTRIRLEEIKQLTGGVAKVPRKFRSPRS
ncbi:MAG: hypothetical protein QOI55_547, partial [Actinomycetota bacterium]|nr:hypothetical protein [Actinomycetota bacterium]